MTGAVIRAGQQGEGEAIGKLLMGAGFGLEGIDWSEVHTSFLVAEIAGQLVACLQICPSRPVGRLEMLAVTEHLEPLMKARLTGEILETGLMVLKGCGSQLVAGMVPFTQKQYRRVLKKRGAWIADTGHLLMGWLDEATHVMGRGTR